ncbi:MAG: hypothetical protein DMF49_00395 [Acidobacteria bacterium]|nr:MAG: hypothetical protein DMF49_00395 [Acidobacteriota bacterium]
MDVNCTFLFTGGHYAVVDIGSKSGGLPPSAQTGGPAGGFTITDIVTGPGTFGLDCRSANGKDHVQNVTLTAVPIDAVHTQ